MLVPTVTELDEVDVDVRKLARRATTIDAVVPMESA